MEEGEIGRGVGAIEDAVMSSQERLRMRLEYEQELEQKR